MTENVIEGQDKFDKTMDALIACVYESGGGRISRLYYRLARRAMQLNRKRITMQQTPEGMAFIPRKPCKGKNGKMFSKIRNATWLKARSDKDGGYVEFIGMAGRVATVHHFGLRERIGKRRLEITMPSRPLLGVSDADAKILEDDLYQYFVHVLNKST
ncbi:MAG: phage virion morphogenesis protein [Betaproteobacteria bacterium]|nr:phage virion morphogenesis protein [Betaproteobacteria bacterium]